ncbi:MAG: zinc ribbon domain-containing protein [Acidimicrobiales bacterium]
MPRFLKVAREQIADLQRERDTYPKFSPEWKKLNKQVAKTYRKAHHQSENWARHAAIEIVARYGVISLERLGLENMTRSARGTMEKPGRNVKQKQGLNRSLQDAALGRLAFWVCVKAEEAGRRVWKVNAVNSSRECAACAHTEAGNRKGTLFLCKSCAHRAHADVNAAEVLTSRGQVAEAAWRAMGMPLNHRPKPRLRRRKTDVGAGSAPYATAA